jgi:hypothetical protein
MCLSCTPNYRKKAKLHGLSELTVHLSESESLLHNIQCTVPDGDKNIPGHSSSSFPLSSLKNVYRIKTEKKTLQHREQKSKNYNLRVVDPDPHHFGNLNPHPHPDPHPHSDPDPHPHKIKPGSGSASYKNPNRAPRQGDYSNPDLQHCLEDTTDTK